jgi:hypothetical protein
MENDTIYLIKAGDGFYRSHDETLWFLEDGLGRTPLSRGQFVLRSSGEVWCRYYDIRNLALLLKKQELIHLPL